MLVLLWLKYLNTSSTTDFHTVAFLAWLHRAEKLTQCCISRWDYISCMVVLMWFMEVFGETYRCSTNNTHWLKLEILCSCRYFCHVRAGFGEISQEKFISGELIWPRPPGRVFRPVWRALQDGDNILRLDLMLTVMDYLCKRSWVSACWFSWKWPENDSLPWRIFPFQPAIINQRADEKHFISGNLHLLFVIFLLGFDFQLITASFFLLSHLWCKFAVLLFFLTGRALTNP